ncbi:MAG TPA: alpha/beta hydrolase [Acidimicrobiia bacterium]
MINRSAQSMMLSDGRQLGYAEWGSHDGEFVVLDFHGGPGCRLVPSCVPHELDRGVRWITTDRPGLGLSWPQPNRRLVDFVADVAQLANHLRVDRFYSVGWSMGGPYAAACAAVLGDRVRGFALLAPAPIGVQQPGGAELMGKAWAWQLARDDPWQMCQIYTALALETRRNPKLAVELFAAGLSVTETELLARPEVADLFCDFLEEATRQGAVGVIDDLLVEMQPWGYDASSITTPGLLWQGDDDSFITAAENQAWADAVPSLTMRILPGEGHLFPLTHTRELVDALRALRFTS